MLSQRNLGWTEQRDGSLRIDQQARTHTAARAPPGPHPPRCETPPARAHRATTTWQIVVPRKRSTVALVQRRLAVLGINARKKLSEALGRRVHLYLSTTTADATRQYEAHAGVGAGML